MPRATVPGTLTVYVANALRGLMARYQIRQIDMAAVVGVSQSHLSQLLRGARPIDLDQFARLCAALAVSPGDLITEAENYIATHQPAARKALVGVHDLAERPRSVPDAGGAGRLDLAIRASGIERRVVFAHVVNALKNAGLQPPSEDAWETALNGPTASNLGASAIGHLAALLDVPASFLTDTERSEASEYLAAELDFRSAVAETGVQIAARSNGALTTKELKAVAEAVRRGQTRRD